MFTSADDMPTRCCEREPHPRCVSGLNPQSRGDTTVKHYVCLLPILFLPLTAVGAASDESDCYKGNYAPDGDYILGGGLIEDLPPPINVPVHYQAPGFDGSRLSKVPDPGGLRGDACRACGRGCAPASGPPSGGIPGGPDSHSGWHIKWGHVSLLQWEAGRQRPVAELL